MRITITDRDRELITMIASYGILTSKQIADRIFSGVRLTNDSLMEVLNCLKLDREDPIGPLILGHHGIRLDHRRIRTFHMRACANADLKPIRVHDLRHTFASHYVMNGGSLAELQGLLGHTSPTMTLKYAHMKPGFLESRASVVSFSMASQETEKSWETLDSESTDTPVTHS